MKLFELCNANGVNILIRNNLPSNKKSVSDKKYFIHAYVDHGDTIEDLYRAYSDCLNDAMIEAYEEVKYYLDTIAITRWKNDKIHTKNLR